MTASPFAWLGVVGINEDGVDGLNTAAQRCIAEADHVFGGTRHLDLAAPLINGQRHPWLSPLDKSIDQLQALHGQAVVVLASGDPFCFGIGSVLARKFPLAEMNVHPAPSAYSLGCARLGWAQQDTALVSLCARPLASLQALLGKSRQAMVLCADNETPRQVADYLAAAGFGDSDMLLMEAIGGKHERIRTFRAGQFDIDSTDIHPLNMLALTLVGDSRGRPLAAGRERDWFSHDGQISRAEVRTLSLAQLAAQPGDRLWDVGAGSGAVAIEWLLLDASLDAIAFERDAGRLSRIQANAVQHGVADRLHLVEGDAAITLDDCQAPPDAIFVGGGADAGVLDTLMERLAPTGRLVANAVTLETETLLMGLYTRHGGKLSRIGIEHAQPLGQGNGFQAVRTITQWCWQKSAANQGADQ